MDLNKLVSNSKLIATKYNETRYITISQGINSALGLKWHSLSDKFLFEGIDVETKLAITKMVVV